MVALECALERAAGGGTAARLGLLGGTWATKSITVADQFLVLLVAPSLAAKSPE